MSMPTRAAPSEVQLEAIGSLSALPSVKDQHQRFASFRQRPVAAVQFELQFAAVRRAKARASAAIVQIDAVDELARRLFPGRRPGDAAGEQPRFVEVHVRETGDLLGEFVAGQGQSALAIPEQAVADHHAIVEPAWFGAAPCSRHFRPRVPPRNCAPFTLEKEVAARHRFDVVRRQRRRDCPTSPCA